MRVVDSRHHIRGRVPNDPHRVVAARAPFLALLCLCAPLFEATSVEAGKLRVRAPAGLTYQVEHTERTVTRIVTPQDIFTNVLEVQGKEVHKILAVSASGRKVGMKLLSYQLEANGKPIAVPDRISNKQVVRVLDDRNSLTEAQAPPREAEDLRYLQIRYPEQGVRGRMQWTQEFRLPAPEGEGEGVRLIGRFNLNGRHRYEGRPVLEIRGVLSRRRTYSPTRVYSMGGQGRIKAYYDIETGLIVYQKSRVVLDSQREDQISKLHQKVAGEKLGTHIERIREKRLHLPKK